MEASLSLNEPQRLEALERYRLFAAPNERDFDDLAWLAAQVCQTPISLVSLLDRDRQWFTGRFGVDLTEGPRQGSFCSHTILHPEELLEVLDSTKDPRFADNALVTGSLRLRYYLGAPLVTPDGYALGSLCVLDKRPRTPSAEQKNALRILSRQVMTRLELRRRVMTKESQGRFQQIAEVASHAFWIIELEPERVLYVNPAFERIWGRSATELYANPRLWMEAIHPDDRPAVQRSYEAWLRTPEQMSFDVEYRVVRPDGSVRWVFDRGGTVRGLGGKVTRLAGVAEEITDRKLAEQALRESEERFAAFMQHLPGAAWIKDLAGRYVYANREAERIFSIPWSVMGGKTDADLFPPETARQFQENDRRALVEGGRLQTTEVLRHPDGLEHHSIISKFGVLGADGRWAYVGGVAFDITDRMRAEEALRESEARFRTLFETSPISTFVIDPQTRRILDCNYQATQALGYSREELCQLGISDIDAQQTPQEIAHYSAQIVQGHHLAFETRHRTRSGEIREVLVTARPLQLQGRPVLYVTCNDITENKKAQAALRDNEARLRLAIETAELGSYERNLLTNQVIANDVCRRLLGFPDGPVPSDAARRSVHPEDKARVLAAVDRAFNPDLREVCSGEFRIVTPAGLVHWVSGRGRVLFDERTQPPRPYKFHGVLLDITPRKEAEAILQRRTFHLQLLHKAASTLLLGQPPVDLLRQMHPQIAPALGADAFLFYQTDPSSGHLHLEACGGFSEDQQHKLEALRYGSALFSRPAEAFQPTIATHLQDCEAPDRRFLRKLGFRSYLHYPLVLQNRLHGTLAFASRTRDDYDPMDLDFFHTIASTLAEALERRRLEAELEHHATDLERTVQQRTARLQEMVAELEHFSYTITHDMRAPLRAMVGLSRLLLEDCGSRLDAERLEYLKRIGDSADRMDKLITDTLQYSMVVRGELPLRAVDLEVLLRGILQSYPEFQPPHARIEVQGPLPTVLANEAGLTQCFSNLLSNAVKFVRPGQTPEVRVWAEAVGGRDAPGAAEGTRPPGALSLSSWHISEETSSAAMPAGLHSFPLVRIWFEDRGIGIEKEYHDKIWVMFQRLNKKSYGGTGIGLALVRKAVERMGGRVGLESETGRGSRFWVELRRAEPSSATP